MTICYNNYGTYKEYNDTHNNEAAVAIAVSTALTATSNAQISSTWTKFNLQLQNCIYIYPIFIPKIPFTQINLQICKSKIASQN
jgi:hypothetical protein